MAMKEEARSMNATLSACQVERGEVGRSLDTLESTIAYLFDRVATLDEMLSPVLRERHPVESNEALMREPSTNYGARLYELTRRVSGMSSFVESTIERLEV